MNEHSKSRSGSDARHPSPIDIQKALGGVDYPASRDSLVETARDHHADGAIIELLGRLPSHRYETPADVSKDIGRLR